mgnify:FL=1
MLTVIENNMMVCPFRTITLMSTDKEGIPAQIVKFPECQGAPCPFYEDRKCLRAEQIILGGM